MNSDEFGGIAGVFLASLSGVIVALVGQYLQVRHENQNLRRLYLSARRLQALEVGNNRSSLDTFWRTINALDAEQHQDSTEHLAAMLYGGLLGYELPHWSFVRWERLEAETFAAFREKELAGIDQMNRTLRSITELYSSLTTLTADDKARLERDMGGRFWTNRLAGERYSTCDKLAEAVAKVIAAPSPMGE
ncbi:MAG: hypothetical protein ACLQUY_04675 [Ktedonobacterales bacterium]